MRLGDRLGRMEMKMFSEGSTGFREGEKGKYKSSQIWIVGSIAARKSIRFLPSILLCAHKKVVEYIISKFSFD